MCPDEAWFIVILSIILTIVLTVTRAALRSVAAFWTPRIRSQPEAESEG